MAPSRIAKQLLATGARLSGGLAALRARDRSSVRILGYHRVVADFTAAARTTMPPLSISASTFAAHLDHLARHYAVWPLADAAQALTGERPFPDRPIAVITFDDGYRDVLTHGAPLLAERRLPATMFVTTEVGSERGLLHDRVFALVVRAARRRLRLLAVAAPAAWHWPLARADAAIQAGDCMAAADALLSGMRRADAEILAETLAYHLGEPSGDEVPPLLTADELGRLRSCGFELGAHSETHAHLPLEDDAGLRRELARARDTLERLTGVAPDSLAYPAGRYDRRVMAFARAAGYRIALTTEDRPNVAGADLLRLGRKVVSEAHGPRGALVAAHLDGLFRRLGRRPAGGDEASGRPWSGPVTPRSYPATPAPATPVALAPRMTSKPATAAISVVAAPSVS